MRKTQRFFWLTFVALILMLVGCRNESMYSENSTELQNGATFRQVNKKEIPFIMNFLASKTNDFKVPLKSTNAVGKTETVFGEIDANNIIESINENNEIYYVFSIIPDVVNAHNKAYNLELKTDEAIIETPKVVVYYPTEDWVLNGNGNYAIFSGRAYTYSLDGNLETSVDYNRGTAGPCDPKPPCPDCDPGPGNPPIGGNGGNGGSSGGGGNPGGGTTGGGTTGGGTTGGGTTGGGTTGGGGGCGDFVFSHNVFAMGVLIGWMYLDGCGTENFVSAFATRLVNPCGGGGVVIAPPQDTPCQKVKKKQNNPKYSEKFNALNHNSIFSMNRERGFFERQPPKTNNIPSTFLQIDGQEGTSGLSLPTDLNGIVGLLHSHNDESNGNPSIKIFSPTDVRTFINHFMTQSNAYLGSYTDAYSTVVTSVGSYTLQYTKNTHPGGINYDTLTRWGTWYTKKYQELVDNDKLTQVNVEKIFTQFLKEVVTIGGLEVYRVTGTTATKLEYDGKDNPVKETSCP